MEQTLGKRISAARKKLGWTQDQLAEQLGVTAQAVSKWENDQSCPDITMLPKLAALFHTTTDALLGIAASEPEPVPEVVDNADERTDQNGLWEFKYENSRWGVLTFGIWMLLCGVLWLAAAWFVWDLDLWTILWTTGLMVFSFAGLFRRFTFLRLACLLTGAYFLLSRLISIPFLTDFALPGALILWGISLIVDAFRKSRRSPWSPVFSFTYNGKEHKGPNQDYHTLEDGFYFSGSFADMHREVSLPLLRTGDISTSFGDFSVDLSGVEALAPDCRLDVGSSFGNLTLLVPRKFRVVSESNASFANVEFRGNPDPEAEAILRLNANVSFGQILVEYI